MIVLMTCDYAKLFLEIFASEKTRSVSALVGLKFLLTDFTWWFSESVFGAQIVMTMKRTCTSVWTLSLSPHIMHFRNSGFLPLQYST